MEPVFLPGLWYKVHVRSRSTVHFLYPPINYMYKFSLADHPIRLWVQCLLTGEDKWQMKSGPKMMPGEIHWKSSLSKQLCFGRPWEGFSSDHSGICIILYHSASICQPHSGRVVGILWPVFGPSYLGLLLTCPLHWTPFAGRTDSQMVLFWKGRAGSGQKRGYFSQKIFPHTDATISWISIRLDQTAKNYLKLLLYPPDIAESSPIWLDDFPSELNLHLVWGVCSAIVITFGISSLRLPGLTLRILRGRRWSSSTSYSDLANGPCWFTGIAASWRGGHCTSVLGTRMRLLIFLLGTITEGSARKTRKQWPQGLRIWATRMRIELTNM